MVAANRSCLCRDVLGLEAKKMQVRSSVQISTEDSQVVRVPAMVLGPPTWSHGMLDFVSRDEVFAAVTPIYFQNSFGPSK